jgi:hypothetical protein
MDRSVYRQVIMPDGMMEERIKIEKSSLLHSRVDLTDNTEAKGKIHLLDGKVHQMLLWSNICAVWSYLILIIMIARLYSNLHGKHPFLMQGSLVTMYILLGILLFVSWKNSAYEHPQFKKASKTYLNYRIKTLAGQCKQISFYLLIYAVILGLASGFFFWDIKHGLSIILKITAPVSIATYLLGIYFIIKFNIQRKRLELLDRRIDHMMFMEKVSQN